MTELPARTPCDMPRCPHGATVLVEFRTTKQKEWTGFLCESHGHILMIASGMGA